MTRLNHLRAELELLEGLHTLQGQVGARDEAAKPQTNVVISDSLSKVLEQYNQLSEIAPSAVVGGKQPSPRQLSFLRRAFLVYRPHSTSGWILHTLFYMLASIVALISLLPLPSFLYGAFSADDYLSLFILFTPIYIALLIVQRLARRNAARHAAQLEEPTSDTSEFSAPKKVL
jgi:hypothetical protein